MKKVSARLRLARRSHDTYDGRRELDLFADPLELVLKLCKRQLDPNKQRDRRRIGVRPRTVQ